MKAEESGDISAAVKAFEDAVKISGPYTDEIREILENYYEALGIKGEREVSPFSWRFVSDLGFYGLHYDENGASSRVNEFGGDLFLSTGANIDYTSGDKLHSLGVNLTGDWFLMNDNMPALDTSDWTLDIGADYSLITSTYVINVGVDLNLAQGASPSISFLTLGQKEFYQKGLHRFGGAAWLYYDTDGPLSLALFASWNRTATYGWNGSANLGLRLEADSVMDYRRYMQEYGKALKEIADHICPPGDSSEACEDSVVWQQVFDQKADSLNVPIHRYFGKWLGPTVRGRASYRFKNNIAVETKVNLFYGFVVDGPDADYEKMKKFTGSWGASVYWKPSFWTAYFGFEQIYRNYILHNYYKGVYPESTLLTELKLGFKLAF